jgi:8-oxo-dGTP diphosphatase
MVKMMEAKIKKTSKGDMHYSVGAIIKKDGKYLLMDRKKKPFGFACLAGHVDEGETPEQTLIREVKEESDLDVENSELIAEETHEWGECSHGVKIHHWYIYEVDFSGKIKRNHESKSMGWYSIEEIKKLKLEPAWEHWFKKLKII